MRDSKTHLGPERGGQDFARHLGGVDGLRRVEAIVAIAALFGRALAEVAEQDGAPAGRGFDQAGKRVQTLALALAPPGLDLGLDAAAGEREILGGPEQPGFGGVAVAPGAAGLLIISLDRLGTPAWAMKRTSGLSMPIPKATVATITMSSDATNADWLRARTCGSSPA